ncbi:MAG: transglycosylase SLT domain-containing protein [Kofleriaceae bacterium]
MPNDQDALTTGVLLLGGGAAGYAAGRWIAARVLNADADARPAHARSIAAPATAASSPAASPPLAAPREATYVPPRVTSSAHASAPLVPLRSVPAQASGSGPPERAQPIDPYADIAPNTKAMPIVSTPTPVASMAPDLPTGPLIKPSQVSGTAPSRIPSTAPRAQTGPITMPSQTADPSTSSPLTRRFDPVFERYRGALPIEYLRALVERESSGQPAARTGSAIGLMQIIPVVLDDYNKRHGTTYKREHLVDPATNVAIGCELLRFIIESYRRNHPRIPNLQPGWDNPRFAELLTFGWNAGFSEAGGVGRVVRHLAALGAIDITIDLVHAHARTAGASKHLSNPAKVRWCKSLVALYMRERAITQPARLA